MDYGFVFPAGIHIHDDVAFAEQNGFTHAWLYDSQMLFSDPYASLALCAVNTHKIKLGTGVTNPASRIAPVTACSIATVNELAPGRTILGIGTGNTARRTVGMPAARLQEGEWGASALWRGSNATVHTDSRGALLLFGRQRPRKRR